MENETGKTASVDPIVMRRTDRAWSEYPVGTVAKAIMGGGWYKTERGWKWNGPNGSGGTFPTPGGDWFELVIPSA